MATNSPFLDFMIEIVTNEAAGLPAIKAAGEVISGNTEFNIRIERRHEDWGDGEHVA